MMLLPLRSAKACVRTFGGWTEDAEATVEPVTEATIGQGIEILIQQHQKRWRKRGLPGAFVVQELFIRMGLGRNPKKEWLWLSILNLDDWIGGI